MDYKTYMLFTNDLDKAKGELKETGAHILIELTGKVLLVNLPEKVEANDYKYSTPEKPLHLDLVSNLMVDVWSQRRPAEMRNLLVQILPGDIPRITSIQNSDQL